MADLPNEIKVVIGGRVVGLDEASAKAVVDIEAIKHAANSATTATGQLGGKIGGIGNAIEAHRTKIRDLAADLRSFEKSQKQWGDATASSWQAARSEITGAIGAERDAIRGLIGLRREAEAAARAALKSPPGLLAAQRALASYGPKTAPGLLAAQRSIGAYIAKEKAKAEAEIAAAAEKAAGGAGILGSLRIGQSFRHIIAIFDGAMRHQRGQMIASTSALVRDSGIGEIALKAVGTAGIAIGGGVAAGVAVAIAQLALLVKHAYDAEAVLGQVAAAAALQNRSAIGAEIEQPRLASIMQGAGIFGEGKVAKISALLTTIPGLSDASREALAGVAEAIDRVAYAGESKAFLKGFPRAFANPASGAKAFGVATTADPNQLAAELVAKFAPGANVLSALRQRRFDTSAPPGASQGLLGTSDILGSLYNRFVTPFAPDIQRQLGEAVTSKVPAPPSAPLLLPGPSATPAQNLISTAKAAAAALSSAVSNAPALTTGLPAYAGGGIVDSDQVAQLHAKEMVLPAAISTKLLALLSQDDNGGGLSVTIAPSTGSSGGNGAPAPVLTIAASKLSAAAELQTAAASITDAASAALSTAGDSLKRAGEKVLFSGGSRRDMGGQIGGSLLQSGAKSLYSSLYDGIAKSIFGTSDVGSGISSALFGSGGISGLLGLGGGGGGGSLLGGLFGGAGLLGSLSGGGNQDFSGAVGGATSGGGLGGVFGLLGGIGSLFGFAKGGIVPSAAGGWAVPSLGPGGIPAMLHSQEMVLPADISQGLQGMIGAGGGGGMGHTFNLNISAMDSRSVMNAGPSILAAINNAIRYGGRLYQG
ncbi:MAG: hypothetical protein IVW56_09605 [Candidatus Binataceae bacterium]|nr:hypothetical protein [Candidatus Binataceae bacterium]